MPSSPRIVQLCALLATSATEVVAPAPGVHSNKMSCRAVHGREDTFREDVRLIQVALSEEGHRVQTIYKVVKLYQMPENCHYN